jgi:hypothetical protein
MTTKQDRCIFGTENKRRVLLHAETTQQRRGSYYLKEMLVTHLYPLQFQVLEIRGPMHEFNHCHTERRSHVINPEFKKKGACEVLEEGINVVPWSLVAEM